MLAGFGILKVEFAFPGRHPIFSRVGLDQQQFMAVVGKILQRLQAILIVKKVRDYDQQPALHILADKGF